MQNLNQEIAAIAAQEAQLVFDSFTSEDALAIGTQLIELAREKGVAYVINITLNRRQLFHFSMEGCTPDNDNWVRRKENVVYHFFKSSHRVHMEMERDGQVLDPTFGLSLTDYAAEGGCFPIVLRGAGVVGTVGVSGLPSAEDHACITTVLARYLGK